MNDPIVECGQCGAFLEQPRRKPVSMSKPVSPPTDTTVGLGRMAQHRFLCDLGHQLFLAQPKGSPLLHFSIFSTSKVRMEASAICGDVQADVSLVDNPWLWKVKIFAAAFNHPTTSARWCTAGRKLRDLAFFLSVVSCRKSLNRSPKR